MTRPTHPTAAHPTRCAAPVLSTGHHPTGVPMTPDEVRQLLTLISTYNFRRIEDTDVYIWGEAANREAWTLPEATEAVHDYFSGSTAWFMPGHVTARINANREFVVKQATTLIGGDSPTGATP